MARRNFLSTLAVALVLSFYAVALEYPRYDATFTPARVFFWGPDDYTHVYRAKLIANNDAHRIRLIPQINAPGGVELHWTAPMDYLLAGVGTLVGPLIDHPDPLGVAAAWVPPCLGALYVLALMVWIRRGFGLLPALLAGLWVILSPPFHRAFALGHPDHHGLLELLFVVAVGAWMPRPRGGGEPGPPGRASAIVSGLAIGLAIWVASQALLVWGAILVGVNYACHRSGPTARSQCLTARFTWNVTVATVVLVAWLIENWPDLGVMAIDKVGAIHLALVFIAFLIPADHLTRRPHEPSANGSTEPAGDQPTAGEQAHTTRLIAFLVSVAALTVWVAVYFHSAVEHVSRPEFYRWSKQIMELQPLVTHTAAGQWSLQLMYDRLGYVPFALPALLPWFLFSPRVPATLKCTLGLLAPLMTILAIAQLRWMDHYNLAVVPVVVIGLWEGLGRLRSQVLERNPALRFAICFAALCLLTYPADEQILNRRSAAESAAQEPLKRTDFVAQSITQYEQRAGPSTEGRKAILCEDGEGPMLLYYTGLPVVAAPYHRAIDGIVEAASFFAEKDPTAARERLDRLGVRYVVMPYRPHEQLMNFERVAFGELRSFDPPDETIDQYGRISQKLHYREQEIARTMAYRLAMQPELPCIPGVKLIGRSRDDPRRPEAMNGLLYVVNDLPAGE